MMWQWQLQMTMTVIVYPLLVTSIRQVSKWVTFNLGSNFFPWLIIYEVNFFYSSRLSQIFYLPWTRNVFWIWNKNGVKIAFCQTNFGWEMKCWKCPWTRSKTFPGWDTFCSITFTRLSFWKWKLWRQNKLLCRFWFKYWRFWENRLDLKWLKSSKFDPGNTKYKNNVPISIVDSFMIAKSRKHNPRVTLNIGGERHDVMWATLARIPHSRFDFHEKILLNW